MLRKNKEPRQHKEMLGVLVTIQSWEMKVDLEKKLQFRDRTNQSTPRHGSVVNTGDEADSHRTCSPLGGAM